MSVIYDALKKLDGSKGGDPGKTGRGGKDRKRPPGGRRGLFAARMLFFYGVMAVAAAVLGWMIYQEQQMKSEISALPARRRPPPPPGVEQQSQEQADGQTVPPEQPPADDTMPGRDAPQAQPDDTPRKSPESAQPYPPERREADTARPKAAPQAEPADDRATRKDPFRRPNDQEIIRELERMQQEKAAGSAPVKPAPAREEGKKPEPVAAAGEPSPPGAEDPSGKDDRAAREDVVLPAINAKISRISEVVNAIRLEIGRENATEVERLLAELKTLKKADDPFVRKVEAYLLIRKGRLSDARDMLNSLLEANRLDADAAINMAIVEYNLGERAKARARLQELSVLQADDSRVKKLLEQMR